MAIPKNDARARLIEKVLGDSSLYPDELRSWVPHVVEASPTLKLFDYQLPQMENVSLVADAGMPPFQNSWTNYGGAQAPAGFYKDPFGIVHLSGLVMGGSAGSIIFTLPASYRPTATEIFAVITGSGTPAVGRIDITSSGNVTHFSGGTDYVSLSGISFRAA